MNATKTTRVALVFAALFTLLGCGGDTMLPDNELDTSEHGIINGVVSGSANHPAVGYLKLEYCDGWECWFGVWHPSACSGTLIAPDMVLTAAHCVAHLSNHGGRRASFTLDPDITNGYSSTSAEKWVWIAGGENGAPNDVALVLLTSSITSTAPAMLMDAADSVAVGDRHTLVGYGCADLDGTGGAVKRHGDSSVTTVGNGVLELEPAGQNDDSYICPGDSGGAAFKSFKDGTIPNRRLTGVNHAVVFNVATGDPLRSLETYLQPHRTGFIKNTFASLCDDGSRDATVCNDWREPASPQPVYITGYGTVSLFNRDRGNTANRAVADVHVASGLPIGTVRVSGSGHNQDAQGYARVMNVSVNGTSYKVISWLNAGATGNFSYTLPAGALHSGWNEIQAYIHWSNETYDDGHWVSVNLTVNP